ncbi:MAG: DUF6873 family GME fold protein [Eubacterium sp.]
MSNLPQGQVVAGIVSGENQKVVNFIKSVGIDPLFTAPNTKIDKFISNHSDINLHHLGGKKIIADSSQIMLIEKLKTIGMEVLSTAEPVCGKYPNDCRLNFARIGNRIIGKREICDSILKEHCKNNDVEFINVNQGYGKCSICIVNERAVITDDTSIKKAIDKIGLDCFLISKGDIKLNGHNYGFIGGASVLIDKDKLLFFGNLRLHRDYNEIVSFLSRYNCEPVFTEDFELTDIGGMIPIIEKR